jgi:hypothetical protein
MKKLLIVLLLIISAEAGMFESYQSKPYQHRNSIDVKIISVEKNYIEHAKYRRNVGSDRNDVPFKKHIRKVRDGYKLCLDMGKFTECVVSYRKPYGDYLRLTKRELNYIFNSKPYKNYGRRHRNSTIHYHYK